MNSHDFDDLARVICDAGPPTGATNDKDAVVELLAKLLCAAASGKGALELSKLCLTEQDLAAIEAHPHFFSLDRGVVLLPRYAGYAGRVGSFFERSLSHSSRSFLDSVVQPAINAVLPRQIISDAGGRVIFDNAHQRLAIAAMLDASVGVLTGGPGTGKTATAAALFAIRKRLQPDLLPEHILVTAPTGKAACRIGESILKAIEHLQDLSAGEIEFLKQIRSKTLHKALEWGPVPPERGGPFRRNASRPLEARLVLVDEASMVDLSLMEALVNAMPWGASLLLLGDSDQLESVEVGGFLSELVLRAQKSPLPDGAAACLSSRLGLSPEIVRRQFQSGMPATPRSGIGAQTQADMSATHPSLPGLVFGLQFSRRAMHARWILDLADLVRPGSRATLEQIQNCFDAHTGNLSWHREPSNHIRSKVLHRRWAAWSQAARDWTNLCSASSETLQREALDMLSHFQLLCSTNAQVNWANLEGVRLLSPERNVRAEYMPHGCPIIIQSNSHALALTNGDVGIAIGKTHGLAASTAMFPTAGGAPRFVPLAQLPDYKPAFALTIHKSQGSEWKHIAIELPKHAEAALLSKNLLYTAITRSSGKIDLIGSESVLRQIAELS